MQNAIHYVIVGSHYAPRVSLVLTALITLVFAALVAPTLRQRRAQARAAVRLAQQRYDRLSAHAAELQRYADELADAAQRADAEARRWYAEWESLHRTAESVWHAFDQADIRARGAILATSYRYPAGPSTPDTIEDRRRYLYRAAATAHRRGELSGAQYAEVLLGQGVWSPYRPLVDLEATLRHAVSQRLLSAYRLAADVERATRRAADAAAAESAGLAAQANAAALAAAEAWAALAGPHLDPAPVAAGAVGQPLPAYPVNPAR